MRTFRFETLQALEDCMCEIDAVDSLLDYEEDVDANEMVIYDEIDVDMEQIIGQHGGNEITEASR